MKTSFLLEKKWKGRYCKWARLHLMALAEGEEIGQGGKVLSIVLILANTFGYMSCLWKYQVGNEKYVFRQENVNITQRPQ